MILGKAIVQNGPEYLIEIVNRVVSRIDGVMFVIAGSKKVLFPEVESIAPKRIMDRILFTGFLSDDQAINLLSITDVYVLPFASACCDFQILEVVESGIPCIVSIQSGISEVLEHTLKSDYWDTEKIANHIVSVLKYRVLSQTMTGNALNDLNNFDWHSSASKVYKIYNELAN